MEQPEEQQLGSVRNLQSLMQGEEPEKQQIAVAVAVDDSQFQPVVRKANISVVVRVRPLSDFEVSRRERNCFRFPGNGTILVDNKTTKQFGFSVVFEPAANQQDVFDHSGVKKLVNLALDGFSCTCLAYGQTGSGKTHTLLGPSKLYGVSEDLNGVSERSRIDIADPSAGLIPRTLGFLLKQIGRTGKNTRNTFNIQVHFIEIYNEHIRDLLELNPLNQAQVRYGKEQGFFVENVRRVTCKTVDELIKIVEEGVRNRQIGSTHANETSSRGHAILTLEIDSESSVPNANTYGAGPSLQRSSFRPEEVMVHRHGKLTFVDLAGSEKLSYNHPGMRTTEGKKHYLETSTINKSLLALGSCISALSDPKKFDGHIPYRESKLTKLLFESLCGNGYTLLITCVTPSSSCISESMNTLRYAQRAKKIRIRPQLEASAEQTKKTEAMVKRELEKLRNENYILRERMNRSYDESATEADPADVFANVNLAQPNRDRSPIDEARPGPVRPDRRQNAQERTARTPLPRASRPAALGGARQPRSPFEEPRLLPRSDSRTQAEFFGARREQSPFDEPRSLPRPGRPTNLALGRRVQFDTPRSLPRGGSRGSLRQPVRPIAPRGGSRLYDGYPDEDDFTARNARRGFSVRTRNPRPVIADRSPSRRLPPMPRGSDPAIYALLQEYALENELLRRENEQMLQEQQALYLREQQYPQNGRIPGRFDQLPRAVSRRADGLAGYRDFSDDYSQPRRRNDLRGSRLRSRPGMFMDDVNPYIEEESDFTGANAITFRKQRPPRYQGQRRGAAPNNANQFRSHLNTLRNGTRDNVPPPGYAASLRS